ncbi:MAG: FkbM family methyltransferase [Jatrophihabitantaceae bacterium]
MGNRVGPGVRARTQVRLLINRCGFELTREQFKHRFVHMLDQHGIDTVLDVGANTGQFGQLLRRSAFTGRIHSIEPLQSAFDELRPRAAADPRWSVQRAAVSDRAGTLTMNVSGNSVSSSVLPMLDRHTAAAPQAGYVATEEVVATTVDDIVTEHGLRTMTTLLKVDVQGYEQAVLDGARKTLDGFAGVRTELSLVALYEGQPLLADVVEYLGGHGFELWHVEPGFVEPGTRRLLQLDGVFFRGSVRADVDGGG